MPSRPQRCSDLRKLCPGPLLAPISGFVIPTRHWQLIILHKSISLGPNWSCGWILKQDNLTCAIHFGGDDLLESWTSWHPVSVPAVLAKPSVCLVQCRGLDLCVLGVLGWSCTFSKSPSEPERLLFKHVGLYPPVFPHFSWRGNWDSEDEVIVHGAVTIGAVSPVWGLRPLRHSVPMLCMLRKLQKWVEWPVVSAQPTVRARLWSSKFRSSGAVVGIKNWQKRWKTICVFWYLNHQQYTAFCWRWVELRSVPKGTCHTWVSWHWVGVMRSRAGLGLGLWGCHFMQNADHIGFSLSQKKKKHWDFMIVPLFKRCTYIYLTCQWQTKTVWH